MEMVNINIEMYSFFFYLSVYKGIFLRLFLYTYHICLCIVSLRLLLLIIVNKRSVDGKVREKQYIKGTRFCKYFFFCVCVFEIQYDYVDQRKIQRNQKLINDVAIIILYSLAKLK